MFRDSTGFPDSNNSEHNNNQIIKTITSIRRKYELSRIQQASKKQQLLDQLKIVNNDIQNLNAHEQVEIIQAQKQAQKQAEKQARKNNEDFLLERFEPLFQQDLVKFGMAVATLIRLNRYADYKSVVKKEFKKTKACDPDQVMKTIINSAKTALAEELYGPHANAMDLDLRTNT